MSFSRSKMKQNVIFECKQFFKIWHVEKFLIQNLTRCFFSIQNLTRCIIFYSKSAFQILAELLSKCYQNQRATCWEMTMAWVEKIFHECVACVCFRFGTFFWLLRSLWHLGSWWVCWLYHLHCQLIYTNLFGFQKLVSLQRFYFKR